MPNTPSAGRTLGAFAILLAGSGALHRGPASSILWTTPLLLAASMLIAWAAESAQFFIAQGFALAILAWLQTLPEFAVEAVLAWRQETPLLLSNLTGALRLLTGVGWPLIYGTAAVYHRLRKQGPLRKIELTGSDSAQVITLLVTLVWITVVFFKGSLGLEDSVVLIALYGGYLWLLNRTPSEHAENLDDMERVPRAILRSRPSVRNLTIVLFFLVGGGLIFVIAEPFLDSLMAVSAAVGITQFVAVQWIAPFVSEFPEKVSAFYWARSGTRAPMALMNMVSSNINQWTLLAAMLPVVLSMSTGRAMHIIFDRQQNIELLMTLAQSLAGGLILLDLALTWWQATLFFLLWAVQFGFSIAPAGVSAQIHEAVTLSYIAWAAVEVVRYVMRGRWPRGIPAFRALLRSERAA